MTILHLTFYFEPDLGPGAFRNTSLVNELANQLTANDKIQVITTQPNRYDTYRPTAPGKEDWRANGCTATINRVQVPAHKSGFLGQIRAFWFYFWFIHRATNKEKYDFVFASSSRLFTSFLGALIARKQGIPLFLDIRDLFREALLDLLNRPVLSRLLNPFLRAVERYTFGYASYINLVSEGFRDYFEPYPQAVYSYFTNGIDDAFLDLPASLPIVPNQPKTILYAGNIGEGQSLQTIIPEAARQLGNSYRFVIIGDGSARLQLEAQIRAFNLTNVVIKPPVNRQELLNEYQKADYLFLHLNNVPACQRVLPSKLLEYGATDKPILAGVSGYAASFVQQYLPNCLVFSPGDVSGFVNQLRQTPYRIEERIAFKQHFQRSAINRKMARQLIQYAHSVTQSSEVIRPMPARNFRSVFRPLR